MTEPTFKWAELGPGSLLDQIICECGWESGTYFDGQEYAHSDWCKHVKAHHHQVPDALQRSPQDIEQ